jgi:hypothetical protein
LFRCAAFVQIARCRHGHLPAGGRQHKFGIVGGSDSHNTGTSYRQDNFFGGHALNDGDLKLRMAGHVFAGLNAGTTLA